MITLKYNNLEITEGYTNLTSETMLSSPSVSQTKDDNMNNTTTVTKKEYDFLNQVINSEFSEWVNELHYVGDYVSQHDYDMKTCRGLMSSLEQKNIIIVNEQERSLDRKHMMSWVSVKLDYLDFDNYKLKNIEVRG
jgi:hypothetical protein